MMGKYKEYIAHTRENSETSEIKYQYLIDHLLKVSKYCEEYASDFSAGYMGKYIGLLHDLGKIQDGFQDYIRGESKIKVKHAAFGAKMLLDKGEENKDAYYSYLAYPICCHHTGLKDSGNKDGGGSGTFYGSCKEFEVSRFFENLNIAFPNPQKLYAPFTVNDFGISFYIRMLFSCLVDADWRDTEEFCNNVKRETTHASMEKLNSTLDTYLNELRNKEGKDEEINKIRNMILYECIKKAKSPKGLFSLCVPTGGGKTISSLAFAVKHAKENGMKRIIYVIPYTSIIEQNAKVIKDIIGEEFVLEHHMNAEIKEDDEKMRWASENWDIPITITTNVQFFESLFSNKTSKSRKVHNMSRSVIIFDEAQMLPIDYLSPCVHSICELVKNYGSSAVLCSATKPVIDNYKYKDMPITEIVSNTNELFEKLNRVDYKYIDKKDDEEIVGMITENKSALVIVNSRRHAYKLYDMIKDKVLKDKKVFVLSTLLRPYDRLKKIEEIKKLLKNNEDVIVVSTQLIECGVDVDFPVVFRAVAGIDSIVQSGGRANREGKLTDKNGNLIKGKVYVFESTSKEGKCPSSIKPKADKSREIIGLLKDRSFGLDGVEKYFKMVYQFYNTDISGLNKEQKQLLDKKDILGSLKLNGQFLGFDYKYVNDNFEIIKDNTYSIFVSVKSEEKDSSNRKNDEKNNDIDESKSLRDKLILLENDNIKNSILTKSDFRKMNKYIVNIYETEFNRLLKDNVLIQTRFGIYILNNDKYYDKDLGLDIFSSENKNAEAINV